MKQENNKTLSRLFKEMSAMYKYIGGDDRFRALAYEKASKVIGLLPEDISVHTKDYSYEELPGIGEGIAGKIDEFIKTGKIKLHEQLKKSTPFPLLEMMEIKGFGPQSLKRIHEELTVSTKDELIEALKNGSVANLKNFGPKKIENMLRGLKLHKTIEDRMLLSDALEMGDRVLAWVNKIEGVKQAELAGSLRRKKETIGDIDVLVTCEKKYRKKIIDHFSHSDFATQILAKGDTKISIVLKGPGRQADLRIINENEWGTALQYFTGSKEHNIHIRKIAKEKGYKISEYGIFYIKNENKNKIACRTEEEVYKALGFQLIPPEMREDRGEIELASHKQIPQLLTQSDIKGDLQMHSDWSDGLNTIEEIRNHIKKNFDYEYIAITDHSKSSRIAKGLDEKEILKQVKAIETANKKSGENFIKAGIEVDILPDGSLDISDEILSQLDWVTASIHSNFNKDNTERIIKACQNPHVHCIGHPTGRRIGSREPYKVDIEKVIKAAKQTHTALEINAQPDRMDLNDVFSAIAREQKVKLVISTDSHSLPDFNFMKLGVFIARRAWCTADDILNTKSWDKVKSHTQFKKEKKQLPVLTD